MWADGIVAEAAEIGAERMGVTARRAIGYAQALAQRRGDLDERAAIAETQALTRKYARRQVSWFKRYPDTLWLDADDPQRVVEALSRVDK
jgi:tRNA dimethylallyltransferase